MKARNSIMGIFPCSVWMYRAFFSLNLVMRGGGPSLNNNFMRVPCLHPVCKPLMVF